MENTSRRRQISRSDGTLCLTKDDVSNVSFDARTSSSSLAPPSQRFLSLTSTSVSNDSSISSSSHKDHCREIEIKYSRSPIEKTQRPSQSLKSVSAVRKIHRRHHSDKSPESGQRPISKTHRPCRSLNSADIHNQMTIGICNDQGVALSHSQVVQDRRKRGLCTICGVVKTHKKCGVFLKMKPITKEGEVYEGKCLMCTEILEPKGTRKNEGRFSRSSANEIKKNSEIKDSPRTINDIVRDMKDHIDSPTAQSSALYELAKIHQKSGSGTIDRAFDAVIEGMDRHMNNVEVQKNGCQLLRQITTKHNKNVGIEVDVDACYSLEKLGGVYVVTAAIAFHQGSLSIQVYGARVIRNILMCVEGSKNVIISHQGIESILRSNSAKKDKRLDEDRCAILWTLAFNNENAQRLIVENGGVKEILETMRNHTNVEQVQYHGCGVLQTLSAHLNIQDDFYQNGGLAIVLDILEEHLNSKSTIEVAITTIASLEFYPEPAEICKRAIDSVVDAMRKYSESRLIQKYGCTLLMMRAEALSDTGLIKENPNALSVLLAAADDFPEECLAVVTYVLGK